MTPQTVAQQATRPWHVVLIVLFVICLRLPYLGNPAINIDEQYYLVFADKWLNGGLIPYVDIWDRKPIGIFLLYGPAVRWFADGVVGYQLTACAFVILTCAVVYRIGRLVGEPSLALAAALIYALCPSLMDGAGGQTPVFYNLPIAAGALLVLQVLHRNDASLSRVGIVWRLLCASLLFGIALQIKYVCVLEAATLCLIALIHLWWTKRLRLRELAGLASGMILCGLAATLIASLAFFVAGYWHAFFYANFQSIFAKKIWRLSFLTYLWRLLTASAFGAAFLPLAAYALARIWRTRQSLPANHVWVLIGLMGWIVAAFVSGLLLGNPTSHYFLPSAAPLSVLAALGIQWLSIRNPLPRSDQRHLGMFAKTVATLVLPTIACYFIMTSREDTRGNPPQVYAIAQTIKDHMHGGCLYVFDHFPVLYYLTHSCAPTIYTFPNHLNELSEMHSLEIDSLTELRRTLASRPAMIFVRRPFSAALDPAATADLEATLAANYKLDAHFDGGWQSYDLYVPAVAGEELASTPR